MTRRHHRNFRRGTPRKFDIYRTSTNFAGAASGTPEAFDIMGQFKTDFGATPYQATLSMDYFDLQTFATGTITAGSTPSVTLGFLVGPATLDAIDLNPSTDANKFWWVRKYYVDPSTGRLVPQYDVLANKVRTRRTLKVLGDTLWCAALPNFAGATALATAISFQVGILYA